MSQARVVRFASWERRGFSSGWTLSHHVMNSRQALCWAWMKWTPFVSLKRDSPKRQTLFEVSMKFIYSLENVPENLHL